WYGIRLESSSTNNIINNNASLNGEGIYLSYSSNNNNITNNTANLNSGTYGYGIWLWDSYNNILTNNKACKNSYFDISCLIGGGEGCEGSGNIGVDNECNTTGNNRGKTYSLNDTGTTGCTYSCACGTACTADRCFGGVCANNYKILGDGVCECDSCDTCNQALNDNTNCGKLVKLTANITNVAGTCINDPANFTNKTFDCQGNTIDGDDNGWDYGIYLSGKTNNTIKNCIVTGFRHGIYLESSSNYNILTNNTANNNTNHGIYLLFSSNYNILTNNTANNNTYGILLHSSSNNNILTNNTANSNGYGIYLYSSLNNILTNNTASSNNFGIYLESSSNNNTLTNNTANNNAYGIYLYSSSNYNTITNNTANLNGWFGIYLESSSNNILNTNILCSNIKEDINISIGSGNSGDNNKCDKASGYNDTGTTGCTYSCACGTACTADRCFEGVCANYKILGDGVCECDTCDTCNQALNDSTKCGRLVKLTANITNVAGTCINNPDNFNNKIFDCQGHTISGTGSGHGIYLKFRSGNAIKNCVINGFGSGITVDASSSIVVRDVVATSNLYGIQLIASYSSDLHNNRFCSNSNSNINLNGGNQIPGDSNTCDKSAWLPNNWDDDGTTGCTWNCAGKCNNNCSLCNITCGGDSSLKCD
ncbi:MAG: hypothetical protein CVT90_02700, partial [Candidatus Altiarchaeales archaeon HGW-Altiarchaeales-3]